MSESAKTGATGVCSNCGRKTDKKDINEIDGKNICASCLYGKQKPFNVYPIGFVRNDLRRDGSRFGLKGEKNVSRIELFPSQRSFLYKLEEEKRITVIYYLHEARPVRSVFKRGLDGKKVGVFASRTPDRLSRLAIQDVRLLKIEGTSIYVEGLDAIDGSPVLDIKMGWSAS